MKKALFLGVGVGVVVACLARSGWAAAGEDEQLVKTNLTNVRLTPDAFKSVSVRFTVQFHQLGKISNPFFTRFVPTDFVNFYGWASEQPIWRKDCYDDVFGLLFLSKENKQLSELYTLKTYERLEVTGVVRNVFQGAPWIEVMSFKRVADKVTTATLAHVYRGEELMKKRQWQMAITELSVAPADGTPVEIQSAVHKNLGICYLRLGESGTAMNHLQNASSLMPGGDPEAELMLASARARPDRELDRAVSPSGVKEGERPFWEAFEDLRLQAHPTNNPPEPAKNR